jgi:hypothetical protein
VRERRERARDRWHEAHAGVYLEGLPARAQCEAVLLFPIQWLKYQHRRFQRWACLPGDRFEDLMLNVEYEIVQPYPQELLVIATSRRAIAASEPGTLRLIPRKLTFGWWRL